MEEIDQIFKSTQNQLENLGDPRATVEDQRAYLFELSQSFQAFVKASAGGNYNSTFFDDANTDPGYQQRIRAVVQNLNEDFASTIALRGHYRQVVDSTSALISAKDSVVIQITKDKFIAYIEQLMRRTRGCELPGTFNPMIVADLFLEQSRPWEAIARRHVEQTWLAASRFLDLVLAHIADETTAKALQHEVFEPAMRDIRKNMGDKTSELLNPHQSRHPITYNPSFTTTLQNVRHKRRKAEREAILTRFFKTESPRSCFLNGTYDLGSLADLLAESGAPDMKRHAASEAMDCLDAYYKVSFSDRVLVYFRCFFHN